MTAAIAYRVLRRAAVTVVTALAIGAAGCSGSPPNPNPRAAAPLSTVPVDLPRYMGRWYVIANIPYFAERRFVGSRAEWRLRDDGSLAASNQRWLGGVLDPVPSPPPARYRD